MRRHSSGFDNYVARLRYYMFARPDCQGPAGCRTAGFYLTDRQGCPIMLAMWNAVAAHGTARSPLWFFPS